MRNSSAQIIETALEAERAARLRCPPNVIPAPGQYVLAHAESETHAPLAVPLFPSAYHPDGFAAAGPLPPTWSPGLTLQLCGPLGRGFSLPPAAKSIGLIGLHSSPARLLPLIAPALARGASVSLACASIPSGLPAIVEAVPLSATADIAAWCDFLALDLPRNMLPQLPGLLKRTAIPSEWQALVLTPLACGGLGECGVCAVNLKRGWKLACKDGPVLTLKDLI